ncbi:MAG: hypothetical protein R6V10_05320 [bacterium]
MKPYPGHKPFLIGLAALLFISGAAWGKGAQTDRKITDEMKKKFEGVQRDLPKPMKQGAIRLVSEVDKKVIRVGDIIHYDLIVEAPENSKVGMPRPGSWLEQFMIRDYHIPVENEEEEKKRGLIAEAKKLLSKRDDVSTDKKPRKFSFEITSYETGELLIPSVPVMIMDPAGDVHALLTEPVRIRVAPVTDPDELSIKDIERPVEVPVPFSAYWYLVLVPALILAAVPVGYWLYRRRGKEELTEVDLRPAHLIAREELDRLEQERLLEAGEYEKFYTRLSWILRKYLSLRYSMYALEYTTREIIKKLSRLEVDFYSYEKTKGFLEEADKVKFACHTPELAERNSAFSRVREIIETTREREEDQAA